MRFALVAFAAGCRTMAPTPEPVNVDPDTMVVVGDLIVQTTPDKLTVRSATHGGVELEWSKHPPDDPGRVIEDRGELTVHHGSETCAGDVDGDNAVFSCGDLVIAYLRGLVLMVGRDPLRVIGTRSISTTLDFDCGTHMIDESVMIDGAVIKMHGFRTIRCVGGGPPGPLIF